VIRIATLKAAGLSAEQIVAVLEAEENECITGRREQNRINQKNSRARRQHVSADSADSADTPSPSSSPSSFSPTPPLLTTPPPSPSPAPAGPLRAAQADDGGEAALFDRGKRVLGKTSGGLIKRLLDAKEGKIPLARAAIEQASTKQSPREYIAGVVNGRNRDPPPGEVNRYVDPRL
jgi:hypothetical protein